ncbi:hypothetical protein J5S49_10950 [Virgibacillus halodenitrificans]|uniref:hypothetical protein n=1 Tax=Virgibacillus halodenitrificans TaxID=1482 RepID=UPI00045C4400|nr:hypothetical protein [Virgibacillus halodenitrificans]MCG1028811.1 hypothetical protein [Virgibacillus halodenitrificans]CDQ32570.1 hypothetical protein BN993_01987 [Virgibacillus halodenitrificans]
MKRSILFSVLISLILLAGCSSLSRYDDNEVAAVVKDQEITVGDLRFLYPDDKALDYLDWTIKVELVKQEVEKMNIEVTDKLNREEEDDWFGQLPPENTEDQGGKQIRKFAETQAKKLNMKPEEFQKQYAKIINEQNAYMITYLEEKTGIENVDDEAAKDEFNEKSDALLEELVEENKDGIEVLIQ